MKQTDLLTRRPVLTGLGAVLGASVLGRALLTGTGAWPAKAAGTAGVVDLGAAAVGRPPPGFTLARTGEGAPGAWEVVADASVPSGRVLAQTSADGTDHRFPLAIYEGQQPLNGAVSVRFKAVAGRVDRAGGIAIRLRDPDNYYVVRANALEDNVNFYRVVKGDRRELRGASAKVPSDVWHTLELRAEGDLLTVSFNGKSLFSINDRTFPGAGKVALWTKADSVTRFDRLVIGA